MVLPDMTVVGQDSSTPATGPQSDTGMMALVSDLRRLRRGSSRSHRYPAARGQGPGSTAGGLSVIPEHLLQLDGVEDVFSPLIELFKRGGFQASPGFRAEGPKALGQLAFENVGFAKALTSFNALLNALLNALPHAALCR